MADGDSDAFDRLPSAIMRTETGCREAKMINLDHQASTIVKFLDTSSVSHPVVTGTYDQTVDLLVFAAEFSAQKLLPYIKEHLYRVTGAENRAADLLSFASNMDDWAMGRQAIRNMSFPQTSQIKDRPDGLQGFFKKLRPDWRHTLIELIFFMTYDEEEDISWDWSALHSQFVAPERISDKRKAE